MTVTTVRYDRAEVLRHTGLTYRRLDYWVRRGVLGELAPEARGSGAQRVWTTDAVHALTVCRRVAECATPEMPAGIDGTPHQVFPLDTLVHVVRELADRNWPVEGWLLVCGDIATWVPTADAVAEIVAVGGAWIVTALDPSDRPA